MDGLRGPIRQGSWREMMWSLSSSKSQSSGLHLHMQNAPFCDNINSLQFNIYYSQPCRPILGAAHNLHLRLHHQKMRQTPQPWASTETPKPHKQTANNNPHPQHPSNQQTTAASN